MSWRLGISRIGLSLWAIWATLLISLALTADPVRLDDDFWVMLFGPLGAFVVLGLLISWIIDGFNESPRDQP